MSDRPEWMPSESEINIAVDLDSERWMNCPMTEVLIRRTGLRAQIAVLEEVVEELNGFSWAQLKIAALRKELENG